MQNIYMIYLHSMVVDTILVKYNTSGLILSPNNCFIAHWTLFRIYAKFTKSQFVTFNQHNNSEKQCPSSLLQTNVYLTLSVNWSLCLHRSHNKLIAVKPVQFLRSIKGGFAGFYLQEVISFFLQIPLLVCLSVTPHFYNEKLAFIYLASRNITNPWIIDNYDLYMYS